jgi:hypothetical protein
MGVVRRKTKKGRRMRDIIRSAKAKERETLRLMGEEKSSGWGGQRERVMVEE